MLPVDAKCISPERVTTPLMFPVFYLKVLDFRLETSVTPPHLVCR